LKAYGSLKAKFCREGCVSIVEFCRKYDIPHNVCGKLIVATEPHELHLLENLYQRGLENSIPVRKISIEEAKEIEPHVSCIAAINVASTGITDYKLIAQKYAELIQQNGGEIRLNIAVDRITERDGKKIRLFRSDYANLNGKTHGNKALSLKLSKLLKP
jgi:L-2-hydroxyglutarate oxidase